MEDINLSNCEVIKIYSDDMKFSQKISKIKSCMVYPKSDTKGIVSIYDSSYELNRMKWLDDNGYIFKKSPFKISYFYKNIKLCTSLDFF